MSNTSNAGRVLRVGIFFDGTANNQFNSLQGQQRQEQGLMIDAGSSYAGVPTNIAGLHQCYPVQSGFDPAGCAVTSLYIGGIGTTTGGPDTPFPGQTYGRGKTGVLGKAEQALAQLTECLKHFVALLAPQTLNRLQLDLFGFSRGAAAARHFVNLFNADGLKTQLALAADFECAIHFIGLFDTVAAMGGLEDWGDVGDDVNPGLNLYLSPDCAQQVVQLSARDEQRRNFSLTRIAPQWPMDVAVPGAHADVGGGYPLDMQEQVFLTRWQSNLVPPSTAIEQTRAWKLTQAQLLACQAEDLIDPLAPDDFLRLRTVERNEGSREDPMKRVQAAVFMQRRIDGRLARVYLRIMHALACEHGVPFRALPDEQTELPDELLAIMTRLAEQVRQGAVQLTADEERLLRQRYIHRSANWNAGVGAGEAAVQRAFFNIPQEGGRSVFDQKAPDYA